MSVPFPGPIHVHVHMYVGMGLTVHCTLVCVWGSLRSRKLHNVATTGNDEEDKNNATAVVDADIHVANVLITYM